MAPRLNIPQYKFLTMPQKYRAFVAGFGSGKTWVGCESLVTHHKGFPKIDSSYFAPTYKLVKSVFFPTIEEVAFNHGFDCRIKVADLEVHLNHGRRHYGVIHCRTLDNPTSIVGFKSGHALIDELDTLPTDKAKDAWRKVMARMRYKVDGVKNGIDVTTTPEGFRFVYERFKKAITEKPESASLYGLLQASTYDNEANLPDDYIPSLVEDYPEQLISAYIQGEFVNLTSGTVYKNYDREAHRSHEVARDKEQLFVGMDFNVTKMAATIYVKRKGKEWHAVDEVSDGYDTPDMIETLKGRYEGHHITVYPDASGKARKTVGASISDIALLRAAGFDVKAKDSNPLIRDRVLSVNSAFHKNLLFVNDRICKKTAECLEQQVYDKNGMPDKTEGKDHQNDATGYPIAYEMPVRKPVTNVEVHFP